MSESNIKNVKHYQEITFEALSKLIEEEAKKAKSRLVFPSFPLGKPMIETLKSKGFKVYEGMNSQTIEW